MHRCQDWPSFAFFRRNPVPKLREIAPITADELGAINIPSVIDLLGPLSTGNRHLMQNPIVNYDTPETVEADKAYFDRIRRPISFGENKNIMFLFKGNSEQVAAISQEVIIGDVKVSIVSPFSISYPAGNVPQQLKQLPSFELIANSLGTVPERKL